MMLLRLTGRASLVVALAAAPFSPPSAVHAQDPAWRDTAEASVIRAVRAIVAPDTGTLLGRTTLSTFFICGLGRRCPTGTLDSAGLVSVSDHAARNARQAPLPDTIARLSRLSFSSDSWPPGTCRTPWVLRLSRVGFDAAGTSATISWSVSTGTGEIPGPCGDAFGGTTVLRRGPNGEWDVLARLSSWIA